MRIGLLTTSYPRFPGDWAGGFVAEHAAFLARAGHDVEVIAGGTERDSQGPDQSAALRSILGAAFEANPAVLDGRPENLEATRRPDLQATRAILEATRRPDLEATGAGGAFDANRPVLDARPADLGATPRADLEATGDVLEATRHADPTPRLGSVRVHRLAAGAALFDRSGAPEELARGGRAWLSAARYSLALTRAVAARAGRWDAIVAHWLVPSGLAAIVAAPRLPLLAIAHSGDVHLLGRLRALRAMGHLCDRPDLRLSFVSDQLRRQFLAGAPRCEPRSQVCPMGIDLARLQAARRRTRDAAPRASARTVLFLGRLVPVKGVDQLIRAALCWQSDARLVIAGAGPDEVELRNLCVGAPPGRIAFAGAIRGADRDRALAAADVVVLPSVRVEGGRSEGLPLVALEAMAAGAALVASSVGGLADLPGHAVTHVAPGDPAALARAIDDLLADPGRLGAQVDAQDRLVLLYDWSAVGPRLVPPVRSRSVDRRSSVRRPAPALRSTPDA